MNLKLIDSIAHIIKSLTLEEKMLLEKKIKTEVHENVSVKSSEVLPSSENNNNLEKWTNKLQKWSERHTQNIPMLSDYDVSRTGIYEED
ncbi:hypothetical protein [Nostoc sp. CHAB 5715]|uniref:hypothetical protein n=1 Tax=Nostoc sp. CHAB 5715 TaxID=2780400 RepID=UPI001E5A6A85|nr:hypothetical protein [Nostoc sp. CHAB 5715]MCC5621971.1 hypothetical protein [Nostoc sp. CHAB 5715]